VKNCFLFSSSMKPKSCKISAQLLEPVTLSSSSLF
jgi:hypothetical protein